MATGSSWDVKSAIDSITPVKLFSDELSATGSYDFLSDPRYYTMFIVRVLGNVMNHSESIVTANVSTSFNIDATASIYIHTTFKIDLSARKLDVTTLDLGTWTTAQFEVQGINLPGATIK